MRNRKLYAKLSDPTPKEYEFTRVMVTFYDNDHFAGLAIQWAAKNMGFGEMVFHIENGKLRLETECMSDDFVVALLKEALPKIFDKIERVD